MRIQRFYKINEVLKDPFFDCEEIKTCLTDMKDDSISDENYPRKMKDMTLNATNATYLLVKEAYTNDVLLFLYQNM